MTVSVLANGSAASACHAPEAEAQVLGALLSGDPEAPGRVFGVLAPAMLYAESARRVAQAAHRLWSRGAPVGAASVLDELVASGELDPGVAGQLVGDVLDNVPTTANVEFHATVVAERYARRSLAQRLERAASVAAENGYRAARDLVQATLADIDREVVTAHRVEPLFDVVSSRFGRFLEVDPPDRDWLLSDVLPLNVAGLLAAMGGVGKSVLLYMLAISVSSGLPFLGLKISESGGVLGLYSEDDEDELHRRGRRLISHYQSLGYAVDTSAVSERLHVISRIACDNLLTRVGADGEAIRTPNVERLIEAARAVPDLKLITIDPVSRFRGGAANNEEHATRFVEAIEAIRDATGATVIAAAHATKLSAVTGDVDQGMVRGSSALVDGLRWVATLQKMSPQQAEAFGVPSDERRRYLRLEIPKSNYTAPFAGLWLERQAGGILVPASLTEVPATDRRQAKHDAEYRDILDRVKALVADVGPITRRKIRSYSGRAGRLGAGDHAVRAVVERAAAEGELIERDGVIHVFEDAQDA